MNTPPNQTPCPQCGKPFPEDSPEHLCPHCVMGQALEELGIADESRTPEDPARLRYLGDYELEEEIGRGAMGVVFRARQTSLDRTVAIKLLIGGFWASKPAIDRFRDEARSAAKLRHPNIVTIHEVGNFQGQAYFSMDLVAGHNLQEELSTQGPLPIVRAAEMARTLAHAVESAHQQGVIHRDLKPSNVLLDSHGNPIITDFGLVKNLEAKADLTVSGTILGTPGFMPPEQLERVIHPSRAPQEKELEALGDIYALGAVLYAMLTGRPPIEGDSILDVALRQAALEPELPRRKRPEIPPDLEAICMKALVRSPMARYASAGELAEDLGRFLEGKPTLARPIGAFAQLRNYWQEHPLTRRFFLFLVILLGLAITLDFESQRRSKQALKESQFDSRSSVLETTAARADLRVQQAQVHLERGRVSRLSGDRTEAMEHFALAAEFAGSSQEASSEAVTALHVPLIRAEDRHPVEFGRALQLSQDGSRYAVLDAKNRDRSRTLEIRDAADGSLIESVNGSPILPISKQKPFGVLEPFLETPKTIAYFDPMNGVLRRQTIPRDIARLARTALWVGDPTGRVLAAMLTDETVHLWEGLSSKPQVLPTQGIPAAVVDGKLLYTRRHALLSWDLENQSSRSVVPGGRDLLQIYPTARLGIFRSQREQHLLEVWDLETEKLVRTIRSAPSDFTTTSLSWDNQVLAVCEERSSEAGGSDISIWSLSPLTPQLANLEISRSRRIRLASRSFSPDGRFLAAYGDDGETGDVLVWESATGRKVSQLDGSSRPRWSPDGHLYTLAGAEGESIQDSIYTTGSREERVIVFLSRVVRWEISQPIQTLPIGQQSNEIAFSPSGDRLAIGKELWSFSNHKGAITQKLPSPLGDGDRLLFSASGKPWILHLPETQFESQLPFSIRRSEGKSRELTAVTYPQLNSGQPSVSGRTNARVTAMSVDAALSLDGDSLIVTSLLFREGQGTSRSQNYSSALELWSLSQGRRLALWNDNQLEKYFHLVELSPRGDVVAVGSAQDVSLWKVPEGSHLRDLDLGLLPAAVVFSLDGHRIFAVGSSEQIESSRLDGSESHKWPARQGTLQHISISADGQYLATAGAGPEVALWDSSTGDELARWQAHEGEMTALAFHPVLPVLVTAGKDRTLGVWNLEEIREELAPYGFAWQLHKEESNVW